MLPQQYYNEKVHILTGDFCSELYVLPDFIILLWQHILFLVQGGKCLPARETTYTNTQIQYMLPQQYYNEKVHILTGDFC